MSYPRTIDDLKPSQLVTRPVVIIDYDLLDGLPARAPSPTAARSLLPKPTRP